MRKARLFGLSYNDVSNKIVKERTCAFSRPPPSRLVCVASTTLDDAQTSFSIDVVELGQKIY